MWLYREYQARNHFRVTSSYEDVNAQKCLTILTCDSVSFSDVVCWSMLELQPSMLEDFYQQIEMKCLVLLGNPHLHGKSLWPTP